MQHEIRRQLQKLSDAGMLLVKLAFPEWPSVFAMECEAGFCESPFLQQRDRPFTKRYTSGLATFRFTG
jgi:hypothetical protein